MKVTATKPGFFGKLRATGEVFEVPDTAKASWFTPVDKPAGAKKSNAKGEGAGKTGATSPAGDTPGGENDPKGGSSGEQSNPDGNGSDGNDLA